MQKSGTGYRSKSNIKTKAHTSPISYQSYQPFFLLFILIEGKWIPEFVNMERVAHIFLHKVGIGELLCSVLKTLFIIDPLEYVFCSDLRPEGVFFFCMLRKLWANEWYFCSLNNSRCCLSVFCYHTLQLTSHLYTVYLPPVFKLPRLSPGLVDTVTWLYTPYW